ncbi:CesD/SycD/LcrH family type III secretion system chaperone [Bordetella genomosp. 9]|uniref:SycD/LcrH family type III secretion system chaperone n=1 Tax=Bordetella genomosp. 9 TaxID=1416803 RepID=UPI000A2933CA|nr:SycD/LcrH family type III secretion system chaperone [Bordetella genomosp. 9]ARP89624.1 CesD/SycD/LcrH family type III secretion system chaperone [Bordetella genomosp. 9]
MGRKGGGTGAEDYKRLLYRLSALVREGGSIGQMAGVTQASTEGLYAVAYETFQKRQYEKARVLFSQLVVYDHMDSRFIMGLAATLHKLERFEEALRMYAIVAMMKIDDPVPFMMSGDAQLALGRSEDAMESYALAMSACLGAAHETVRERCMRRMEQAKENALKEAGPAEGPAFSQPSAR